MRTAPKKVMCLVIGVWCFFAVALFIFPTSTHAATDPTPTPPPWNAQSQSTYTLGNLFESGLFGLSGVCLDPNGSVEVTNSTQPIHKCDQAITKQASGGAIGFAAGVLSSLYNPPTSSAYYLANLGESFGLGPNTAYAQVTGSGERIVAPIYKLWEFSRNLAYLALIIVFVIVGFMIMFRQKLNPQTVIGVQQALPGLIIALILITFSYLIASLIVDFAFIGVQLVAGIFVRSELQPNSLGSPADILKNAPNSNIFSLFTGSAFNGKGLGGLFQGLSGQLTQATGGNLLASSGTAALIGGTIGAIAGPFGILGAVAGGLALPVIIPAIVCLVLLIALFIQMFKLLFALLSAYISILIMTLAGPFFILSGAIPGRGKAISSWMKNLLANVLIFPAVFAGFLFAGFILGQDNWNNNTLPLFGGVEGNFIKVLIGYGILLGIPGIPNAIKGAFGVKDQNPITQAAMGGAMGGATVGSTAATSGYGKFWRGGAQKGSPAAGAIATWAQKAGLYRGKTAEVSPSTAQGNGTK